MSHLNKTRRVFLNQLAMLTAAVSLSPTSFASTSTEPSVSEPQLLWKRFCQLRGAVPFQGSIVGEKLITPTKGHAQRKGQEVWFPEEQIIAAPVWIYWGSQQHNPSDLIVNFYPGQEEGISINRYELDYFIRDSEKPGAPTIYALLEPRIKGKGFWMARIAPEAGKTICV